VITGATVSAGGEVVASVATPVDESHARAYAESSVSGYRPDELDRLTGLAGFVP